MSYSKAIDLMRMDLESDARVLRAKKRIFTILRRLPDDIVRRRVIIAAAAMVGIYDLRSPSQEAPEK